MSHKLKLMAVLAHPDDESFGIGGALAKYADEGIETYLVVATRGERGRFGESKESPGLDVVGKTREAELLAAAKELGVREVLFLDYIDGDLDKADPVEVVEKIVLHLRRIKPHVVISLDPTGGYGHPDHIAISQFTTAALVCSGDHKYKPGGQNQPNYTPHIVSKFYFITWPEIKFKAYQSAFREMKINLDGETRKATPWPDWSLTTWIDTVDYWPQAWRAIHCHKTQLTGFKELGKLPEETHKILWGSQEFYRVFSLVNGGRVRETDLFNGLR